MPRAENSRAALLEHGTQLMVRSGSAGTGLVELAQSAGMPKGSFSNHLGSKEELGVELVQRYCAEHERLLASPLTQTDRPPLEACAPTSTCCCSAVDASPPSRGCLLGMLALEMAGGAAPLRASVSDALTRWQARLAELLRRARVAGERAPEQPRAAMRLEGREAALVRARASRDLESVRNSLDLVFSRLPVTA